MNRIGQDIHRTLSEHPTADDNYVARKVLRDAGFTDAHIAYVADIVSYVVASQRRSTARSMERAAFADFVRSRPTPTAGQRRFDDTPDEHDPFRALITAGADFKIRGKGTVTWARATITDHQERIAFLSSLRNGLAQTIAQHEAAIDRIRSAGVICLADIDEEIAA